MYLAGPEVFLSNAAEVLANRRKVCKVAGWIGLSPVDNEIPHDLTTIDNLGVDADPVISPVPFEQVFVCCQGFAQALMRLQRMVRLADAFATHCSRKRLRGEPKPAKAGGSLSSNAPFRTTRKSVSSSSSAQAQSSICCSMTCSYCE